MPEERDPYVGEILKIYWNGSLDEYEQLPIPFYNFPIPHAEPGRRAKVYKLKKLSDETFWGLKAFTKTEHRRKKTETNNNCLQMILKEKFYVENNTQEDMQPVLSKLGLKTMHRTVISKKNNPNLCEEFPNFEYGVLMPWLIGEPWANYIREKENSSLSKKVCVALARKIAGLYETLERNGMAHCDVSGDNVFIEIPKALEASQWLNIIKKDDPVQLIDLEEMFEKSLIKPSIIGGSPGYAHQWAKIKGSWEQEGDRVALGILLCEVYTWHRDEIRHDSSKPSFFKKDDFGTECEKYQVMSRVLAEENKTVHDLFQEIWVAKSFEECPPISEWKLAFDNEGNGNGHLRQCPKCGLLLTPEGFCAVCDKDKILCSLIKIIFGKIDINNISAAFPKKIRIQNIGEKRTPISIRANVDWVSLQTGGKSWDSLQIPPNDYREIEIVLKENLPREQHHVTVINAIQVTGPVSSASLMIEYEIKPYWTLMKSMAVLIGFLGLGAIAVNLPPIFSAWAGALLGFTVAPSILQTQFWKKQAHKTGVIFIVSFLTIFITAYFGWNFAGQNTIEESLLWSGLLGVVVVAVCFLFDREG